MNIAENLSIFNQKLKGTACRLIAVSKTYPPENILEAYNSGQRAFGENKVQEMQAKYEALPKDIEWHQIGHLQTNKVKLIASFVTLIHSIDSLKLLQIADKEAAKHSRIIPCLLQMHIASEETKFGFSFDEVLALFQSADLTQLNNIKITGLMGMATNTPDHQIVRKEFKGLKTFFELVRKTQTPDNVEMKEISMGMSGDYEIAVEEGSTMIRVGSAIFGNRTYA